MKLIDIAVARIWLAARDLHDRSEGQTLVEYALILTMISIGSIALLLAISGKLNDVFGAVRDAL